MPKKEVQNKRLRDFAASLPNKWWEQITTGKIGPDSFTVSREEVI